MHWQQIHLRQILNDTKTYLLNPIQGIRQLPSWTWVQVLVVQGTVSMISGLAYGLVNGAHGIHLAFFLTLIKSVVIGPIISTITCSLITMFLYYSFLALTQQTLPIRSLFTVVVLSCIPFFALDILSPLFLLSSLIGFLLSAFILIVGLVENFRLEKRLVLKVVGLLFGVFLIIWVTQTYGAHGMTGE